MNADNFPIGPFEDFDGNPILTPSKGFQSKGVFNPSVVKEEDRFWMLYRAEANDGLTGRIGIAQSIDGFLFSPRPEPVLSPDEDFDKGGCEDPRVAKVGDTYFLVYVGNSEKYHVSNICLATSKDLFHWRKHGPVLDAKKGAWDSGQLKAGVILPEKIGGKYVMYFMGEAEPWVSAIGIAYSYDLYQWEEPLHQPVVVPRSGFFDSQGVEPGPNPIILDEGILLIYNGWGKDCIYKAGGVLFSKENPTEVIKRADEPLLNLSRDYGGRYRTLNHCVTEGLIRHEGQWFLYYGAADRLVCIAVFREEGKSC
jgi:predicted GH43/DUF377 family glycosyl hydrolase